MAGFKRTVKDMNPDWFITFDGDTFILQPPIFTSNIVIDEMGNTAGLIHDESNDFKGYAAGTRSHVELEQTDQYSCRWGYNLCNPDAIRMGVSKAPCSYIEVPLPDISGFIRSDELTLIWLMKKDRFPKNRDVFVDRGGAYQTLEETIIRVGNLFEIGGTYSYNYSSGKIRFFYDELDTPLGEVSINSSALECQPVETRGRASFCVVRMKGYQFEFWVDGHLVVEKSMADFRGFDSIEHTVARYAQKPIRGTSYPEMTTFIGGRPTNWIRNSSPRYQAITLCELDQISLHHKWISDDEIMELYRRVWHRNTMFAIESPGYYLPFNTTQQNLRTATSVEAEISRQLLNPKILGIYQETKCEEEGMFYTEKAIRFPTGGLRMPTHNNYNSAWSSIVNWEQDFTWELCYKGFASKRISIFESFQIDAAQKVRLFANSHENVYRQDWVEFQFGNITKRFHKELTDNRWHKIVIRRKLNKLDFIIDEEWLLTEEPINFHFDDFIATLMLTSQEPNTSNEGTLSELLVYNQALTDIVLKAHMKYDKLYRINGTIVKAGQPFEAIIRAYSWRTGSLLKEVKSNRDTGNFLIPLTSNELVYLVCVAADDREMTRLRAVGAINPDVDNVNIVVP